MRPLTISSFVRILLVVFLHQVILCVKIHASDTFTAHMLGIFVSDNELPCEHHVLKQTLEIAKEKVTTLYPHIAFHLVVRNSETLCNANMAAIFAAEEYYRRKVTAFIGPGCSTGLEPVGNMASYWNLPVFSSGGIDNKFSNKIIYLTLTRLGFSLQRLSEFVLATNHQFNWHRIAIVVDETDHLHILMRQSLELALYEVDHEVHIGLHAFSRTARLQANFTNILQEGSQYARIFILVAKGYTVRNILLAAHDLGMSNGEYAFLTIELFKNKRSFGDFSWFVPGDSRNKDARKIYESLMVFSVRVPTNPEYETFIKDTITRSNKEFNLTLDDTAVNVMVAGFHDCVLMYAWALNETLAVGDDPLDGYNLIRRVWNNTFHGGLTGDIYINENGDREADYTLSDMDPKTGEMRVLRTPLDVNISEFASDTQVLRTSLDVNISEFASDTQVLRASLDINISEFASDTQPVALYLGPRKEYQPIDGVNIHWPGGKGPPPDAPYCGFFGENPQCQDREEIASNNVGDRALQKRCVGMYKFRLMFQGMHVSITFLDVKRLIVTRNLLLELKQIRDITHENLVRFIGLSPEEPNVSLLMEHCPRGTLQDLLSNDSMKIDWPFRFSIISDIVEVPTSPKVVK
ncbi:atrial natriuretic peptide receptor 1-like, partial [Limulus polyphemus]|uniref:Atrial natriuretic peptide receptor 1-like n=1 Tax=Limulus polyphemus TaxID=6850 RepID=A0ABM1TC38_LIMPO